jgi:hypothetical protein
MPKPREYDVTGRKKLAHGKGGRWCKQLDALQAVL